LLKDSLKNRLKIKVFLGQSVSKKHWAQRLGLGSGGLGKALAMEHRGMLRPTRSSLSAVGKRCNEDKTLYIHITPPLTKPGVVGSALIDNTY
jgi:hypothetical protein